MKHLSTYLKIKKDKSNEKVITTKRIRRSKFVESLSGLSLIEWASTVQSWRPKQTKRKENLSRIRNAMSRSSCLLNSSSSRLSLLEYRSQFSIPQNLFSPEPLSKSSDRLWSMIRFSRLRTGIRAFYNQKSGTNIIIIAF